MSRRNRGNHKGSFAIGAILGGVLGGVTALLFAPKSGDKFRKDIARKYDEVSDKTCELFEDVCEQSKCLVEKAKEIAHDAKEATSKLGRTRRRR